MARASFIHQLIHSRLLLAAGVLILAFVAFGFGRQALSNRAIGQAIADLQKQANDVSTQNAQLNNLQQALQTETYLEGEARLELGMKKPGEHVVVVEDPSAPSTSIDGSDVDPTSTTSDTPITDETPPAPPTISNPRRWWDYFFDRSQYTALAADYASS